MRISRKALLLGLMLLIGAAGMLPLFLLASPVTAAKETRLRNDISATAMDEEAAPEGVAPAQSAQEGEYIVQLAAGCGCHFSFPNGDYRGGDEFSGPFGTVYARNITPDPETGIGNWTDAEIETAIRTGRRPNGEQLFPIMPYMLFSRMAEDDMDDLIAYLKSLDPVSNTIPARQLNFPVEPFTPTVAPPATAPLSGTVTVTRGEYIVNVLADCGGCHGANLAGQFDPSLGGVVPNITPDPETGIGDWTVQHIATELLTKQKPDIPTNDRFNGGEVGGIMGQLVDFAFSNWTQTDAESVGQYLKTVEPVQNTPTALDQAPQPQDTQQDKHIYLPSVMNR